MADNDMDEVMSDMEKLLGTQEVNMNEPVQEAEVPDHFKDIDPKEFKEGGRYYFPNNGLEDSEARDENCPQSIFLCCCARIHIL